MLQDMVLSKEASARDLDLPNMNVMEGSVENELSHRVHLSLR